MDIHIDQVLVGGIRDLPPQGQPTGIFKQAVGGPVQLGRDGLAGDVQAARRVHGGPEKALHHYAADNYAELADAFPALATLLVPGSLGENLSTRGATEESVCIGDVFRAGSARIQVSQPRSPCWKINHKFGEAALSRYIADHGLTGWYYRVLEAGWIGPGDTLKLIERNIDPVSLRQLWQVQLAHRPTIDELERVLHTPGLSPGWVHKLAQRLDWLRHNSDNDPQ